MLFDSSFRKELGRSFSATLVVLVTIVMTVLLIRTLGYASRGRVDPSEVMLVLGYTVLGHASTILTLSLFIAVTATLTRMYAASEMVVWFASGRGLLAFLKPVLRFAWPVLASILVLSLLVWPWSNQQIEELRTRYQGRGDIDRVAPGRFIESAGGQRVFFIDKDSDAATEANNIFIAATENGRESVTSAQRGHMRVEDGQRFAVLENGQRLEIEQATGRTRISHFAELGNRIAASGGGGSSDRVTAVPTLQLLQQPTPQHLGELSWRLGLLLAAFNCVLFALAATRVNPRVGRSAGLLFALFTFVTYYNLVTVGESWIASGRVGFVSYMLLLHGGLLALSGAWLLARHKGWAINWQRLRARKEAA